MAGSKLLLDEAANQKDSRSTSRSAAERANRSAAPPRRVAPAAQPTQRSAPAKARPRVDTFKAPSEILGLSADELRKRAVGVFTWQSASMSRGDTIPPASDERTALIDRGLVLRGLLTQEQIDEAQRVGELWVMHRHTTEHARLTGRATAKEAIEELRRQKVAQKAG